MDRKLFYNKPRCILNFKIRLPTLMMLLILLFGLDVFAQDKLEKHISIKMNQKPLKQALAEIGRKGDFYFSYNTNIIKGDSLVNLGEEDRSIKQILEKLLGSNYEFLESGRYIIILQKSAAAPVKSYTISGYVMDGATKEKISNASVYENNQLVSTLTDTSGFFRLRLKDRNVHATLVVSKQLYSDTLFLVEPGYDQQFTLNIQQARFAELSPFVVSHHPVEKTWLGKWILSSKEIVQSMNLMGFFADKPFQFSLTPGLGTHGHMGAQVINKFSLNVIGGYTAGIDGFEMAGAFNIDKKDVRYVQLAGGFNVVGGKMVGGQMAGVYNLDLDSVTGGQAGGVANRVKGSFTGAQLAGIFNHVEKTVKGLQAAGIYNHALDSVQGVQLSSIYNYVKSDLEGAQVSGLANRAKGRTTGVQMAGLANSSQGVMEGVQVSGFLNYTSHLKGVQIGLVNIADTADGYMLGLINIVKNGYHKLSLSSNEILPINLSYKTGARYLYSILAAGYSPGVNERAYSLGLGIGTDLPLSKRLAWATELTYSSFYLGTWDAMPNYYRLQTLFQLQLGKRLSLFAGPAFSIYDANHVLPAKGYKTSMPANTSFGWTAGINFF